MIKIQPASPSHMHEVYSMMLEWAHFEGIEHRIRITEAELKQVLFCDNPTHFAAVALDGTRVIGISLFNMTNDNICVNVKHGIFIETMYVLADFRQHGVGKALFEYVVCIAKDKHCSRLEGWVSNDNVEATDFYKGHGVSMLENLTVCKLELVD